MTGFAREVAGFVQLAFVRWCWIGYRGRAYGLDFEVVDVERTDPRFSDCWEFTCRDTLTDSTFSLFADRAL